MRDTWVKNKKIELSDNIINQALVFSRLIITLSAGFVGLSFALYQSIKYIDKELVQYVTFASTGFIICICIGLFFELLYLYKVFFINLREGNASVMTKKLDDFEKKSADNKEFLENKKAYLEKYKKSIYQDSLYSFREITCGYMIFGIQQIFFLAAVYSVFIFIVTNFI